MRQWQAKMREHLAQNPQLRREYRREKIYPEKISPAVRTAERNTGRRTVYDESANYSIRIPGYSEQVQDGLSAASEKVARLGSADRLEHMILVDLSNGNEVYYEKGDASTVGGREFWNYVLEHSDIKLAFIHNHNTDGSLSETDLKTLLTTANIRVMIAVRNDGVKYVAPKNPDVDEIPGYFDGLYEKELALLNQMSRSGKIDSAERTRRREEIITESLLRDYVKGYEEQDGRPR